MEREVRLSLPWSSSNRLRLTCDLPYCYARHGFLLPPLSGVTCEPEDRVSGSRSLEYWKCMYVCMHAWLEASGVYGSVSCVGGKGKTYYCCDTSNAAFHRKMHGVSPVILHRSVSRSEDEERHHHHQPPQKIKSTRPNLISSHPTLSLSIPQCATRSPTV